METGKHYIAVSAALAREYNAAPKTQQRKLQKALLRSLLAEKVNDHIRQDVLPKNEASLFLKINRTFTEAQKLRFEQLNEKRLNDVLTPQEFSELESLIQELEQIGVERLQAVIELARLRQVEASALIEQLELEPLVQISQNQNR